MDFIDSAGLALLVGSAQEAAPESRALNVLLTPSRQPERVLKLGRFDTIMNLAYSLDDIAEAGVFMAGHDAHVTGSRAGTTGQRREPLALPKTPRSPATLSRSSAASPSAMCRPTSASP